MLIMSWRTRSAYAGRPAVALTQPAPGASTSGQVTAQHAALRKPFFRSGVNALVGAISLTQITKNRSNRLTLNTMVGTSRAKEVALLLSHLSRTRPSSLTRHLRLRAQPSHGVHRGPTRYRGVRHVTSNGERSPG